MHGRFSSRAAMLAVLLLLPAVLAGNLQAADEGVLSDSKDAFTTDIQSADDVDIFTLELLEGTKVSLLVKAGKDNGLLPDVKVFRPDGSQFDESLFAKKVGSKKPGLKNLPVDVGDGGLWAIRIGSSDGETGEYVVSFKVKTPKKTKAKGLPVAAGQTVLVKFGAQDGALVTAAVTEKDKKTGTPLAAVRLIDPFGREVPDSAAAFVRKKSKVSLKKFPVAQGFGNYAIEVQGAAGGGNIVNVIVKVKLPKHEKRKELLPPEARLDSISVDAIHQEDEQVTLTVSGANFLEGSTARFEPGGLDVSSVDVTGPDSATVVLDARETAAFGDRTFVLVPPVLYGEAQRLDDAMSVLAPDPTIDAAAALQVRQWTRDNVLELEGTGFRAGGTVEFSGDGITVTAIDVVRSDLLRATVDVEWDAPLGSRDVTYRQPTAGGGASATSTGLLMIYEPEDVQPEIDGAIPSVIGRTGAGGPTREVPVILDGFGYAPGITVSVAGTGVSVVSNSLERISPDRLRVVLSVSSTATTGALGVTVTNAAWIGGLARTETGLIEIVDENTIAVNRVLPEDGEAHGGDRVTIHGSGFVKGAVVDFGSVRGYGTQVLDKSTLVTTVPQPVATSTEGATTVAVRVSLPSADSEIHEEGFSYGVEEQTYFTVVTEVPAQDSTGVMRNLRSACVKLSAPIDPVSVVYGFDQDDEVNWGESGGWGVSGGIHGFGPRNRWLVFSRTSIGDLYIDNLGAYVLNLPTAIESIGGVNLVVNRVASSTFDQRTFAISADVSDTTAPTLTQITPADGAATHVTTEGITLVFSEELDPRTVRSSNVTLLADTTPVGAEIWIDDDLKTVHLVPHTELSASAFYSVSVGSGLTDLCGNAFTAASTTFGTGGSGDKTAPTIDRIEVERIPADFDGSGMYVDAAGQSGRSFDLLVPENGFLLRIEFSDHGGSGIDPATFSSTCTAAIGGTAANAELASNFTLTQTGAEWRIPSSVTIASADNVVFTFRVWDRSANASAANTIVVDVLGRGTNAAVGTGDLDPLPARESWILRFDMDHWTHMYSTQGTPALQGLTTTNVSNATVDFAEALHVVGLQSSSMTTAAAGTVNGSSVGTNAILQRLVAERVREILRMRFGIAADGTHGTDSPDVEFLLVGEQGSLASAPVLSTASSANSAKPFSEISFGGTGGAEANAWTAGSLNGAGYYDPRNTRHQANLNTSGTAGVYVASMLKREVNGFPSRPFFGKISAKFVAIHGGTPVGEHASDDDVLAVGFDRLLSTDTTHNARYDEIMDAIELVALYLSATAAHEIGHSLGVVADGAPKTGQFGGAHYDNPFTDATSTNPNASGHLSVAGVNNLMAVGSNFSLMSRTGTEFQRFAPHVRAYLTRRVIYDEGR